MPDSFHLLDGLSNFLVVFYIDKELFYLSKLDLQNMNIKKLEKENFFNGFQYYLYLAEEQIPQIKLGDHVLAIENIDFSIYEMNRTIINTNRNRISLAKNHIAKMITSHYVSDLNFKLTTFMYLPIEIKIQVKSLNDLFVNVIEHYKHDTDNLPSNYDDLSIKEQDKIDDDIRSTMYMREAALSSLHEYTEDQYHIFLMIWHIQEFGFHFNENDLMDKEYLLQEYNKENEADKISEDEFELLFKNFKKAINQLSEREKEIYFKYYSHYFDFDFIDCDNRHFNDLSHGEQTIFGQLINIYYHSLNSREEKIIYLFNEPDLSLHPQWQKKYLYEVIELFKKIPEKIYHFIFTTHSPFLLSDLQKKNVIFLQDGKQVEIDINPFGANIHTLLSHGFFMKDGLMGEFAKEKINDVINYLNDKKSNIKSNDEAQKIVNIIGEPILKRQLQKMLDSKKLDKLHEIDELKNQIENLKNRLDGLENNS